MKFKELTYKNIRFFSRYYKLVAAAALITVAVITGSLVVGDSVRNTLAGRVKERLGDTETVIFSCNSFMDEKLTEAITPDGTETGILLTNGFISSKGKLLPVYVWGIDQASIPKGSAKLNPALAKELGQSRQEAIVLRLPASGLIPSGSLFVTDTYTTGLRLSFNGIAEVEDGGNISMKNEQVIPLNIFINREELAETLEAEGKINLILSNKTITGDAFVQAWNHASSGLSSARGEGFTEITSDRVFMQEKVTETITRNNPGANRLFSYLANSMERGNTSIPYSFVTAMDRYKDEPLQKDEIILSDYSAHHLKAKEGDRIRLTYYTSGDLKTLKTDSAVLYVKKIIPINELQQDTTLSANFPGLSNVDRCTDWDSDLPINMNLITDEDEQYWEQYRSTPKAIIPYNAVASAWSTAYGNATSIRIPDEKPDLTGLHPDMFGIRLIYPREAGLMAAMNGVDFSSLFLALGFFIIVSAILLMLVPLSEMLYRRRQETGLLKALGFTAGRIKSMLWKESAPVVLVSALGGIIMGLLYTSLVMWLLGNVWKGATQTGGFSVYPSAPAIGTGFVVGIALSLGLLRMAIARNLKEKETNIRKKIITIKKKRILAVIFSIFTSTCIGFNFLFLQSVTLFVIVGILLIATAALWGDYLVCRKGSPNTKGFCSEKLVWSTLLANRKQAALSFFSLAIGVFIVFSVGLNRKGFTDSSQLKTGTGGYSLWCESSVPIYHNLSTAEGREKLSLTGLPAHTEVLQCLRYSADDASCLNLNKVSTPTVLGIDMKALLSSDFRIEKSIPPSGSDSVYDALVDATVLTWSLGKSLGDTLYYEGDRGQRAAIRLAGILSNSIFQGHILIDRRSFSEIWSETTGSEVFLLKVDEGEKEETKTLLSQALNEYGVRVTTTNERLKQFNTVTDTYLTIFLTLGGLGLLLGIMGFIIVIRKNLAMRRHEIELYRTLGFRNDKIGQALYRENLLVPLYAIITGAAGALAGVGTGFGNTSVWIWLLAMLFTTFFILCVITFIKRLVRKELGSCSLCIDSMHNPVSDPGRTAV